MERRRSRHPHPPRRQSRIRQTAVILSGRKLIASAILREGTTSVVPEDAPISCHPERSGLIRLRIRPRSRRIPYSLFAATGPNRSLHHCTFRLSLRAKPSPYTTKYFAAG